jgi:hypothetical protein
VREAEGCCLSSVTRQSNRGEGPTELGPYCAVPYSTVTGIGRARRSSGGPSSSSYWVGQAKSGYPRYSARHCLGDHCALSRVEPGEDDSGEARHPRSFRHPAAISDGPALLPAQRNVPAARRP